MTAYLIGVIEIMTIFLFGCVGEIITEKSGHLNMGTPGIMCVGAMSAVLGIHWYSQMMPDVNNINVFLAILIPLVTCFVFTGLMGLLYCFIVDTLHCNQNVTGLTLTTLGAGLFPFVVSQIQKQNPLLDSFLSAVARNVYMNMLPRSFSDSNWFTQIFLSHSFLTYLVIILAIVSLIFLSRTRIGLSLRSIGENPGTSDASGINVTKYKYIATVIGSCISGIGGLFYIVVFTGGTLEFSAIEGFGWLAVALVIFSVWNPAIGIGGSFLFAIFYELGLYINAGGSVGKEIIRIIPYIFTVIILIVISLFNKRETQPPAALGLPYYREDR